MAETIAMLMGSGGGVSLKELGFSNVPEGNWVLRSSKLNGSFPGFSSDVIPICQTISCSGSTEVRGWPNGATDNSSASINGTTSIKASGGTSWVESFSGHVHVTRQFSNATAYSVFLPWFYNMDLGLVQQYTTANSSAVTVWLAKVE